MAENIEVKRIGETGKFPFNDLHSQDVSKDQVSSIASEGKKTKHKGMLPADITRPNLEKKEGDSFLKEKLNTVLNEVKTAVEKSGFDPRVTNILMLYIAFAQDQMDQNNKLQAGWMDQQHVQNLLLESSAQEQKKTADESSQGRSGNLGAIIGFALLAILAIALIFTGVGAAAGAGLLGVGVAATAIAGTSTFVLAGAGAVVGIGVSLGFAIPAMNNPEADGLGPVTQEGPDQAKLAKISTLTNFWNLVAQMANQNIQTGTQLNIVNTSSSNTQQGQQAGQVIEEWGQMTRFQLAR